MAIPPSYSQALEAFRLELRLLKPEPVPSSTWKTDIDCGIEDLHALLCMLVARQERIRILGLPAGAIPTKTLFPGGLGSSGPPVPFEQKLERPGRRVCRRSWLSFWRKLMVRMGVFSVFVVLLVWAGLAVAFALPSCSSVTKQALDEVALNEARLGAFVRLIDEGKTTREEEQKLIRAEAKAWATVRAALGAAAPPAPAPAPAPPAEVTK